MAYNVYFACDKCGNEGMAWCNHSVSLSICIKLAREAGWKVGKRGWICPRCQQKKEALKDVKGRNHNIGEERR